MDSTNLGSCSTLVFIEKNWHVNGLAQFRPVLFKVQLHYIENEVRKKDPDRRMKRKKRIEYTEKTIRDMWARVEWSNIFVTIVLVKRGER